MTSESQAAQSGSNTALIERLRGEIEVSAEGADADKAYLMHEVGVLHEVGGEEPLAARDYLAAYNSDAEFREPLEALVRILSRRILSCRREARPCPGAISSTRPLACTASS